MLGPAELRYRSLFDASQVGILLFDGGSGQILDANPFLKKLLGYPRSEFVGKKIWNIQAFKKVASSKEAFHALQSHSHIHFVDAELQKEDNSIVHAEVVSNTYIVGRRHEVLWNIRDITDKKIARKAALMHAAALNVTTSGVVITDTKGMIEWVNSAFTHLTGYTFEEAVGKSTRILNSGKQNQSFYEKLWKTILSGHVWKGEFINRKKDGVLYKEGQIITPVLDQKNEIIGFIATKQEVTAKKKLQQELLSRNKELEQLNKIQEKRKQAMLNVMEDLEATKNLIGIEKAKDEAMLASIGDGLIAVDNQGKVIIMNQVAEDMLGRSIKELIGKHLTDLQLEDEQGVPIPFQKRPTTMALSTGTITKVTHFYVKKDKTRFPLAITATPIKLNRKTIGLIELIRDVTREQEIDRAKSEFVSLASHQLRTPLGIIKWYLEALEHEDYFQKSPRAIQDYVSEIHKNNERVLSLVRDLLSVSRIDQGRVKNAPISVDPLAVIREVVEQMQIVARRKKISLQFASRDESIPMITIDILRFHEVLENLIGNAIEYTLPGGSVSVTARKAHNLLFISVKDTGIGISNADQKKLFTKFFRSEKAVGHNPEGSGLGLYVVKSYVEGWGGSVSAQSVEGKGSTFTINLPIFQKNK